MEFLSTTQLFLLLVLAGFIIYLIKTSKEKPKKPTLPPGPKPWPIVGNLPEMLMNKPVFRWMQSVMKDMNTDIACFRLGNVHVITVSSPILAREFLKKQDATFASRPLTECTDYISYGYASTVVVPFGDQWKKMRKIVTNDLLSPFKHQWLQNKRVEEANNLVRYIYNQCVNKDKGGLVDVRLTSQQYCGNAIRRLVFGRRYFGEGRKDCGPGVEEEEYIAAVFDALNYQYCFSIADYLPFLGALDLDGHKKKMKKAMSIIKKYHDPIIEARIQEWKDGKRTEPEDLLDILIMQKDAKGNPLLTTTEIKAQVIELNLATVDNPSNAIEWALAEMINHPDILEKATQELDNVVGKDRLVQESDFPKLNYVKACARETFRLHPVVPYNLPHASVADTVVGNYFIPKGSHVMLSRTGLGRNPEVWKEPLEFRPERHLKSDGSDLPLAEPDLNFISFSTGRRGCPGVMLGSSITVMLFARLLHAFSWTAPPNESSIDLSECHESVALGKPLVALAKPRLPLEVYLTV
ncbi:hypothetical protein L6164_021347 [Bauhinia variegata]|uniref:Uncharacterized protein n=1 Tax=Bauhinia variegata TaxID=167791 RepID=A0ACB9N1S8_BAUVA|nr:hypothetical protein L6164_021347 [Bauhinia variegata]